MFINDWKNNRKGQNEQAALWAAIDGEVVWKVIKSLDQIDVFIFRKEIITKPELTKSHQRRNFHLYF